jgi:hypothetical protein
MIHWRLIELKTLGRLAREIASASKTASKQRALNGIERDGGR